MKKVLLVLIGLCCLMLQSNDYVKLSKTTGLSYLARTRTIQRSSRTRLPNRLGNPTTSTTTSTVPPTTVPPSTVPPTVPVVTRSRPRTTAAPTTRPRSISSPKSTVKTYSEPSSSGWRQVNASWYGPGFYGNTTACRVTYNSSIKGVAHRSLPCGTMLTFEYKGRIVSAPVIDRGPYVSSRTFDLSHGLCVALDHCFTDVINWRMGAS